ncbi:unnamed protein product [Protopolystoma xenopodis]|uniref:Uncharacterized protein n=1 Tax=Protopolystoma xenopodis TaxID=117903 RepID=A0A3S5BFD1_9PLAT|nr:unnamed protein product [Protopolystoma xenopodis]
MPSIREDSKAASLLLCSYICSTLFDKTHLLCICKPTDLLGVLVQLSIEAGQTEDSPGMAFCAICISPKRAA